MDTELRSWFKKREGWLRLTATTLTWTKDGSKDPAVSFEIAKVTGQQQTPPTAEKVILRITVSTGGDATEDYSFLFKGGDALPNREKAKAHIHRVLEKANGQKRSAATPAPSTPASTPGTPRSPAGAGVQPSGSMTKQEAALRAQLFRNSPELARLHRELVVEGRLVTEAEFWESSYIKKIRQLAKVNTEQGQQKGRTGQISEIRPGRQEGSDMVITLTSENIHNIFSQFPSVKTAYDENVPDKMTEETFWTKFLQSELFHFSRTGERSAKGASDPIFGKCLEEETKAIENAPEYARFENLSRMIDLSSTMEDHMPSELMPDVTMRPGKGDAHSLPLIRRVNRHAQLLLDSITTPENVNMDKYKTKQDNEKEIVIEDLADEAEPARIPLDIKDTTRYFESQTAGPDVAESSIEESRDMLNEFSTRFHDWQAHLNIIEVDSRAADRVRDKMSAALSKSSDASKRAKETAIPPSLQKQIVDYHSASNELLRHFWSSNEPYRAEKNRRIVEAIRKHNDKLHQILIVATREQIAVERVQQMLSPMTKAVDKALGIANARNQKTAPVK